LSSIFRNERKKKKGGGACKGAGNRGRFVKTSKCAKKVPIKKNQGEGVKKQKPITTKIRTAATAIEIIAQSGSPNMFVLFFSEFIVPP